MNRTPRRNPFLKGGLGALIRKVCFENIKCYATGRNNEKPATPNSAGKFAREKRTELFNKIMRAF